MAPSSSSGENEKKFKCCKKTTSIVICVKCLGVYHSSCLERRNDIKQISKFEVVCCSNEAKSYNEFYIQGLEKENQLLRQLNASHEETIQDKNLIIRQLQEKCKLLEENINYNVSTPISQINDRNTYAGVTKRSKEGILIIKPKNEDDNEDEITVKDIQNNLKPAEIGVGIASVKNTKNGSIIIKVRNEQEAEILQQNIADKMGETVTTVIPVKRRPCVKIVGFEKDYEEGELLQVLQAQNNNIFTNDSHVNVRVTRRMLKSYFSIIECDPKTFQRIMSLSEGRVYIGFRSCRIYEHVNITRCYNCFQYGHMSKECGNKKTCGKCSSTTHETKDCHQENKCTNCFLSNKNHNKNLDINHSSFDLKCPTYKQMIQKEKPKICYQE